MIEKNNNHVEEGLQLLYDQFVKPVNGNVDPSENIKKLLTVYLKQVQLLEDAVFTVMENTVLNTTFDDVLDKIGGIAGEPRMARNNTQYRSAIQSRIRLNRACGTFDDMIVLLISLRLTINLKIYEIGNATVDLSVNTNLLNNPTLLQQLKHIVAAGVQVNVYNNSFDNGIPFVLSDINSATPPVGGGLYDLNNPNPSFAGKLVDIL